MNTSIGLPADLFRDLNLFKILYVSQFPANFQADIHVYFAGCRLLCKHNSRRDHVRLNAFSTSWAVESRRD